MSTPIRSHLEVTAHGMSGRCLQLWHGATPRRSNPEGAKPIMIHSIEAVIRIRKAQCKELQSEIDAAVDSNGSLADDMRRLRYITATGSMAESCMLDLLGNHYFESAHEMAAAFAGLIPLNDSRVSIPAALGVQRLESGEGAPRVHDCHTRVEAQSRPPRSIPASRCRQEDGGTRCSGAKDGSRRASSRSPHPSRCANSVNRSKIRLPGLASGEARFWRQWLPSAIRRRVPDY
jgi:hypothetical protein